MPVIPVAFIGLVLVKWELAFLFFRPSSKYSNSGETAVLCRPTSGNRCYPRQYSAGNESDRAAAAVPAVSKSEQPVSVRVPLPQSGRSYWTFFSKLGSGYEVLLLGNSVETLFQKMKNASDLEIVLRFNFQFFGRTFNLLRCWRQPPTLRWVVARRHHEACQESGEVVADRTRCVELLAAQRVPGLWSLRRIPS